MSHHVYYSNLPELILEGNMRFIISQTVLMFSPLIFGSYVRKSFLEELVYLTVGCPMRKENL